MRMFMAAMATALTVLVPVFAQAGEARTWTIGGAHIVVEDAVIETADDRSEGQRLTVRGQDGSTVTLSDYRLGVREPAGENLTGGNIPQLAVTGWSGGMHCCFTLHILELGTPVRAVQVIDAGHSDLDLFAKLDDDPGLEIALPDWSYAYWPGSFQDSPVPRVILKWDGQHYAPSAKLMRSGTMLYQMQERRQPRTDSEAVGAVLQDALDMIYAGRMKAARTLLRQLLPQTPENRRIEQVLFDCKLPTSPWWPFIAQLNNIPARPPAASCPTADKG